MTEVERESAGLACPTSRKEGRDAMSLIVSNLDSVIFGIPLLGLLFSAFFRVDELAGKPLKVVPNRRQVSGLDRNGIPLCLDPDRRPYPRPRHTY
jgi:hypothetical protein